MQNRNLTKEVHTQRLKVDGTNWTLAAGTSDVASEIIDMAGYESARFIACLGAIISGGVQSMNVQQDDANAAGGMADLEDTNITIVDTDDNRMVIIDVVKPQKRYLRLETLRETQNCTVDSLIVERYGPRVMPVTQDTATIVAAGVETHISPDEGTA